MLIGGTLGLVMSSPGTNPLDIDWTKAGSMNVVAWLVFWRFVLLAIVFSTMQAFGYAAATISIVRHYHPTPSQVAVDQIWRWVMGLSLTPASVAVVMRFFVPESPRFMLKFTSSTTHSERFKKPTLSTKSACRTDTNSNMKTGLFEPMRKRERVAGTALPAHGVTNSIFGNQRQSQ
jgi:Sugar (and other) transporter